jgi:hypothetical protein
MLRQEDVTRIPDFVGQRVRQVSTVVELVDGTPTRPVYRTFSVLAIKPDGLLDVARLNDQQIARMEGRYRSPRADRERSGPIVDAADRFVARGGSWEPDERLLRANRGCVVGAAGAMSACSGRSLKPQRVAALEAGCELAVPARSGRSTVAA